MSKEFFGEFEKTVFEVDLDHPGRVQRVGRLLRLVPLAGLENAQPGVPDIFLGRIPGNRFVEIVLVEKSNSLDLKFQ